MLYLISYCPDKMNMGYEKSPGDFAKKKGSIYRVDGSGITRVADKIGISNGLAWDLAAKAMCYIDSMERNIRRYDYDVETGRFMSLKVEKISEKALLLGEGPHWDDRVQALYFISVLEKTINKYDPATRTITSTTLGGKPGFIVPVEGHLDHFVVGLEREFAVVQWDGAEGSPANVVRLLGEVDPGTNNVINDGKADPRGRLYAGTRYDSITDRSKERATGSLYRLDESGITALCDKIAVSNGLAWDLAAKAMYYIDSLEKNIRRYDYDVETGDISNLKYIFNFEEHGVKGMPDGCTIDTDGNLWVAVFGGGCVLNISPKGELLRQIPVPANQVTSCTFGGPELDILYVTTGRMTIQEQQQVYPSGCTFQVTGLGVKGHPNLNFKLQ